MTEGTPLCPLAFSATQEEGKINGFIPAAKILPPPSGNWFARSCYYGIVEDICGSFLIRWTLSNTLTVLSDNK